MEEHFEVGDPIFIVVNGTAIYGTIISMSSSTANIDTIKRPVPLKILTYAAKCFRVGSIVQIKENLKHGVQYGSLKFYNSELCGRISKVTKISRNGTYYLENIPDQTFSHEMLQFPVNIGDLVVLKASAYHMFPALVGNVYKVSEILPDGSRVNVGGAGVSPLDLEVVSGTLSAPAIKFVGDDKLELSYKDTKEIFDLKELSDENQLQRENPAVVRGKCPEGSRIYGRRPKATISVRPLSNQARRGFSQG